MRRAPPKQTTDHEPLTDRERKRQQRARENSIVIPKCAHPRRRKSALKDLILFGQTYFSTHQYNLPEGIISAECAPAHHEWAEDITRCIRYGQCQARAAPRGSGKSTWMKIALMWAVFSLLCRRVAIGRQNASKGAEHLAWIKAHLRRNDALAEDFPEICVPIREGVSDIGRRSSVNVDGEEVLFEWLSDEISLPTLKISKASGARIISFGLVEGLRGDRCDLVLVDDPQTDESAASEIQKASIRKTLVKNIGGTGDHTAKPLSCLALMTPIEPDDLAIEFTDRTRQPSWQGIRQAALEPLPDNMDMWETYVSMMQDGLSTGEDQYGRLANAYYLENRAEMDAGAGEFWPAAYSKIACPDGTQQENSWTQHVFNFAARFSWESFWSELQGKPVTEEDVGYSLTLSGVKKRLSGIAHLTAPDGAGPTVCSVDCGSRELHVGIFAKREQFVYNIDHYIVDIPAIGEAIGPMRSTMAAIEQRFPTWTEGDLKLFHALENVYQDIMNAEMYTNADGSPATVKAMLIDSGWNNKVVYQFVRLHPHLARPSKGWAHTNYRPLKNCDTVVNIRPNWWAQRQEGAYNGWLWHLNACRWKSKVHESLACAPDSPGALFLYGDEPNEHKTVAKHIVTSEKFDVNKMAWEKKSQWNHFFDVFAMGLAAIDMIEDIPKKRPARQPSPSMQPHARQLKPKKLTPRPMKTGARY